MITPNSDNLISQIKKFVDIEKKHILGKLTLIFQVNQIVSLEVARERKKDKKVLLQASLLCAMVILTILGFFVFQLLHNRWANVAANLIWLTCAGNNAILYIVLNR